MKNQTINCDVCCCKHHCEKTDCCKLSAITVTPDDKNSQAHFCKNYRNKQDTKG